MRLKVLGSAAGGGFPQWNCNCHNCRGLREGRVRARPRTQSSVAISADGEKWLLVNASPDLRVQLETFLPAGPDAPVRSSPVAAVLLTDAQLDHAAGLLFLRESSQPLVVYCSDRVQTDLTTGFPVLSMLGSYCGVDRRPLTSGVPLQVPELPGITILPVALGGKAPPYSPRRDKETHGETVALVFTDGKSGRSIVYAPGLSAIEPLLVPSLERCDALLVDGTFWTDDEMQKAGCGKKTARGMGHLPLSGETGLLRALAPFAKPRKYLIHINNTNPILNESSAERKELHALGFEVASDGMELVL